VDVFDAPPGGTIKVSPDARSQVSSSPVTVEDVFGLGPVQLGAESRNLFAFIPPSSLMEASSW
jgi:hypothetical protein